MVRFDWMQDLLEWFDWYLKGVGEQLGFSSKSNPIRDSGGSRTATPRWHGVDIPGPGRRDDERGGNDHPTKWELRPNLRERAVRGADLDIRTSQAACGGQHRYRRRPDLRIARGLLRGRRLHTHRSRDNGSEISRGRHREQTWLPIFQTINAKMEFFAMDAQIEAGHFLRLSLASTGEDYLPASTSSIVQIQEGSSSNLILDTIHEADKLLFDPPLCTHPYCQDWLNQTAQ